MSAGRLTERRVTSINEFYGGRCAPRRKMMKKTKKKKALRGTHKEKKERKED